MHVPELPQGLKCRKGDGDKLLKWAEALGAMEELRAGLEECREIPEGPQSRLWVLRAPGQDPGRD